MASAREVLIEALKDVEEAHVPDDLREIAFSKSFDLRAGAVAAAPGRDPGVPAVGGPNLTGVSEASEAQRVAGSDLLGTIAARLKVERTTVADVFTVSDGELELIVPVGKLSSRVATATKEIALLVAVGRQAAGLEEWTSWDEIRRWCAEFKKLDSGNFAKAMREMDDVFNTRKQSDRKLQVRLAKPGWERAADAIRRLGGE